MSYNDVGDDELLYLIRCNNQEAKDCLINRYKNRIFGIINGYVKRTYINGLDYEDLFHECFIVFLKCLELFDENYNFYMYVENAINNQLHKIIKKEKLNQEILSLEETFYENDCYHQDVINDSSTIYKEKEIKEKLITYLDEINKQIVDLKLKGYSYLEIAKMLKLNKKAIYKRVKQIKEITTTIQ